MVTPLEIPGHPSRAPWDAKFHESPTKQRGHDDEFFGGFRHKSPAKSLSFNGRPSTVGMQPPWRGSTSNQQSAIRPSTVAESKGRQTFKLQASSGRQTPLNGRPSTVCAPNSGMRSEMFLENRNERPVTVAAGKSRPLGCPNGRTSTSHQMGSEHLPRYYGNKYAGKRLETTHADDAYHTHFVGPKNQKFGPWTSDLNACGVSMFEGMLGPKYAGHKNLSSIANDGLWATVKSGPSKSDVAPWRHESEMRRAGRPANINCTYQRSQMHELTMAQVMNIKTGPPRPYGPAQWTIRRRVAPPLEGDVKVAPEQTDGFYTRPIEPLVLRRFKAQPYLFASRLDAKGDDFKRGLRLHRHSYKHPTPCHPPRDPKLPTAAELHVRCMKRAIRQLKTSPDGGHEARIPDWSHGSRPHACAAQHHLIITIGHMGHDLTHARPSIIRSSQLVTWVTTSRMRVPGSFDHHNWSHGSRPHACASQHHSIITTMPGEMLAAVFLL
eukprot:3679267-Pyramimonas_sp.AAC.1